MENRKIEERLERVQNHNTFHYFRLAILLRHIEGNSGKVRRTSIQYGHASSFSSKAPTLIPGGMTPTLVQGRQERVQTEDVRVCRTLVVDHHLGGLDFVNMLARKCSERQSRNISLCFILPLSATHFSHKTMNIAKGDQPIH